MNKEDPYRERAEKHRQRIVKPNSEGKLIEKEALLPRSRLHREKRQKQKWKVKYPVISLLALFFILLPVTIFGIYTYVKNAPFGASNKAMADQAGFETVGFEEAEEQKAKGTKIVEREEEPEEIAPKEKVAAEKVPKEEKPKKEDESKTGTGNDKKENIPAPNTKSEAITKTDDQGSASSDHDDSGLANPEPAKPNKQENNPPPKTAQASENKQTETKPEPKEEPKKEASNMYHTVKPNETLYRIAMNYYKSPAGVEIIKRANNLPSNEIRVGQVLTLPMN